jgi:hypothetical protein
MRERNKQIDRIFDSLRRSMAIVQIVSFRSFNPLSEEELRQFGPELVSSVENILRVHDRPIDSVFEDERTG